MKSLSSSINGHSSASRREQGYERKKKNKNKEHRYKEDGRYRPNTDNSSRSLLATGSGSGGGGRGRSGLHTPLEVHKKPDKEALFSQYAVRSPHRSLGRDTEELNQRITNFDPVQESTHHTRCITAIRMSSDSTHPFIVTAGLDCMVFVTDYFSGQVLKKIDTDNSFVFSLDIAADNSVFATAAQDGCVRIYSRAHRWQCLRVIKQQSPGVCRIIWAVQLHLTPAGDRYCVSGGATKVIHVFDWVTGVERTTLRGHQEGVRCLAIAEDGTLASGSNDFTVRLWNLQKGSFLFTLRGHSAEVNALCFLPGSSSLVTACENNIFRVWNYIDGARLMIFDGYGGLSILSLCAVPNAHNAPWILVGGSHMKGNPNLNVEIWNTQTGEKVGNCRGSRYQICGIDVRCVVEEGGGGTLGHDGRSESYVVVAGGLDCKTRCWNLDSILVDRHHLLREQDIVIDLESVITNDSVTFMSSYADESK